MSKNAREKVAEQAARLMVDGVEYEYLDAKDRAIMMLGLNSESHRPTNRRVKEYISILTKDELGEDEVELRLSEMREIAKELMNVLDEFDPFLIGSVLTGKIRKTSDIDLHAYCDDYRIVKSRLEDNHYFEVEEELVENTKGSFVHLKWIEGRYPIEITIYPWSWRDHVHMSSVTGKPMKRYNLAQLTNMTANN